MDFRTMRAAEASRLAEAAAAEGAPRPKRAKRLKPVNHNVDKDTGICLVQERSAAGDHKRRALACGANDEGE